MARITEEEHEEELSESSGGEDDEREAFANLKDERHFEDTKARKARLVMGEPLGGPAPGEEADEEPEKDNEGMLDELPETTEDLELTHLRLKSLKGLRIERFRSVERISLRQNLLTSLGYTLPAPTAAVVAEEDGGPEASTSAPHGEQQEEQYWPLRGLHKLEELDLYDNQLSSFEGLEDLPALTSLDLSFGLFRSTDVLVDESPDSLYAYPELTHLYLIQNKLSKIAGLAHRTKLVYLELGGNRLRKIEGLPQSATLRSLFLGKNKITKLEGLDGLVGLQTLSLQSNRITKIEGLKKLVNLEELYFSHNGIGKIEGLEHNVKLSTLEVSNNKLTSIDVSSLSTLVDLEEFWVNNNSIAELPILSKEQFPNLATVYFEHNPLQKTLGTAYRRKIMLEMPQLKQIDATFTRQA